MANTELSLEISDDVKIEHYRSGMQITLSAETGSVLDHFNVEEIIAYFGVADLLDQIGESEAVQHFGL